MDDCTVCGWELEEDAWFCSNCGVPVHRLDASGPPPLPVPVATLSGAQTAAIVGFPALSRSLPATTCDTCGKPLTSMERVTGCRECAKAEREGEGPAASIERAIVAGAPLPNAAIAACRSWPRRRRRWLFRRVCERWVGNGVYHESGAVTLHALMLRLELKPDEVRFERRVRLPLYIARVRQGRQLPALDPGVVYGKPVERAPGEIFHYAASAVRYEQRIRKRRYVRGSRPALPHGSGPVHVQVAGTRGSVLEEKEWAAGTTGVLLVTDRGIRLHTPGPGTLFIPLGDLVAHSHSKGRISVQRAGRADPYVFQLSSDGPAEIVELCLTSLLGR